MKLTFGYSPCPNDTFIFHALAHGLSADAAKAEAPAAHAPEVRASEAHAPEAHAPEAAPTGHRDPLTFDITLADIDELNRAAANGEFDVAKVSYYAYGYFARDYVLLRAGGALGRGVGPLLVAREEGLDLAGKRVAIPGGLTTANLLLKLLRDDLDLVTLRYDRIMPAVAAGEVDAGLIIHESRFTYHEHGLKSLLDLGVWWQEQVGGLVPLGAIVARRSLGADVHERLTRAIRASLRYAYDDPQASSEYVAANAQEMSDTVRRRHIELYVNEFSFDVGALGEAAVGQLLGRATARGLFPAVPEPLFAAAPEGIAGPGETSLAGAAGQG